MDYLLVEEKLMKQKRRMFDRNFKLQAVQMIHLHRLHDKIAMAFCGHVVAHVIAFILATTHKVSPQDLALST